MNLKQLEYFVSAAENLNFTKAAKECYISQTAMTLQIQALEKSVGAPLFLRDKHRVTLTIAGQVFLKEARSIIDRSNQALRMARLASEGLEGELRIGYIRSFGFGQLTDLLRNYHQTYPNIKLSLYRDNLSILMEKLKLGECDVIFGVTPVHSESDELSHVYIKSYPVFAALSSDHPLSTSKALTYRDLEHNDFIMMQPPNRPKDQMEESMLIYERGGYFPNVVAVEGDPETLYMLISCGLGISILPEYITRNYPKGESIRFIPLMTSDGNRETVDLRASYQTNTSNPALLHFLDLLS